MKMVTVNKPYDMEATLEGLDGRSGGWETESGTGSATPSASPLGTPPPVPLPCPPGPPPMFSGGHAYEMPVCTMPCCSPFTEADPVTAHYPKYLVRSDVRDDMYVYGSNSSGSHEEGRADSGRASSCPSPSPCPSLSPPVSPRQLPFNAPLPFNAQLPSDAAVATPTTPAAPTAPPLLLVLVQFKWGRQGLYRYEGAEELPTGTHVMVRADRGRDLGMAVQANGVSSEDEAAVRELPDVLRIARNSEITRWRLEVCAFEKKAKRVAQKVMAKEGIKMKVMHAEYQFDMKKVTFHFASHDSHPDFRPVLDSLFSLLRCRIWFARYCNVELDKQNKEVMEELQLKDEYLERAQLEGDNLDGASDTELPVLKQRQKKPKKNSTSSPPTEQTTHKGKEEKEGGSEAAEKIETQADVNEEDGGAGAAIKLEAGTQEDPCLP